MLMRHRVSKAQTVLEWVVGVVAGLAVVFMLAYSIIGG